jgi:hypothetical protein
VETEGKRESKVHSSEIKKLLHIKENNYQSKNTAYRMGKKKTFTSYSSDKGLLSRIYKDLKQN